MAPLPSYLEDGIDGAKALLYGNVTAGKIGDSMTFLHNLTNTQGYKVPNTVLLKMPSPTNVVDCLVGADVHDLIYTNLGKMALFGWRA